MKTIKRPQTRKEMVAHLKGAHGADTPDYPDNTPVPMTHLVEMHEEIMHVRYDAKHTHRNIKEALDLGPTALEHVDKLLTRLTRETNRGTALDTREKNLIRSFANDVREALDIESK